MKSSEDGVVIFDSPKEALNAWEKAKSEWKGDIKKVPFPAFRIRSRKYTDEEMSHMRG